MTRTNCTIIIPVYNAFADALTCLKSVIKYTDLNQQILIIDDASNEGHFKDYLADHLSIDKRIILMRNPENLGFVKTVNIGMHFDLTADVLLLNSDTIVTKNWIDKLQQAAYSSPQIGTATPISNNGSICSIPLCCTYNDIPAGLSPDQFAEIVEAVSQHKYVEIPSSVGFCMYIKRKLLNEIGFFDEELFAEGYGEENDFSCRAHAAGYIDVMDDATFVFHKGEASFKEKKATLVERNSKILVEKYPTYFEDVAKFCTNLPTEEIVRRIMTHPRLTEQSPENCSILKRIYKAVMVK